jgi:hypothetical protein
MKRDDALLRSVEHLLDLEVEYDMTVRVLAVVVEMVQQLSHATEIHISDSAVVDQPDLTAWRDAEAGIIVLRATR